MSEVWTYWISRDSYSGVLVGYCSIWWIAPKRARGVNRVTWCPRSKHTLDREQQRCWDMGVA